MFWIQLWVERRSSFPNNWAVSIAYQQDRVGCVIICQARLWKGTCHLQLSTPKACSSRLCQSWLPDSACSFSCHGRPRHLYHWGWTAQCYQRKPKPFLVAGNNEMHKGMAGRKVAKRQGWGKKIKKKLCRIETVWDKTSSPCFSLPSEKFLHVFKEKENLGSF